mgnify:FL=1
MEKPIKKLRLEDIKVESFVTSTKLPPHTVRGGSEDEDGWASIYGDCEWSNKCTNGQWCSDHTLCPIEKCRQDASTPHC